MPCIPNPEFADALLRISDFMATRRSACWLTFAPVRVT